MKVRNHHVLDWCVTVKSLRTGQILEFWDMKEKNNFNPGSCIN